MAWTDVCRHAESMVLRNGPFRIAKRPISRCKTARIAMRNGPFRKSVSADRRDAPCQHGVTWGTK